MKYFFVKCQSNKILQREQSYVLNIQNLKNKIVVALFATSFRIVNFYFGRDNFGSRGGRGGFGNRSRGGFGGSFGSNAAADDDDDDTPRYSTVVCT